MKNISKKTLTEMKAMFSNLKESDVIGGRMYPKGIHGRGEGGSCGHSCSGLSVDCWCEPHCVSGISCTSGWY